MNATCPQGDERAIGFVPWGRRMLSAFGLVPELTPRVGVVSASLILPRSLRRVEYQLLDRRPAAELVLATPLYVRLHDQMEEMPVLLLRLNASIETGAWALRRDGADDQIVCRHVLPDGCQTSDETFRRTCRALTERVDEFLARLASASWNRRQRRSDAWR